MKSALRDSRNAVLILNGLVISVPNARQDSVSFAEHW
jgi:hypothetical protein